MDALMNVYERDVAARDAETWLQRWAEHGWLVQDDPVVVGTTASGDDVLRYWLVRTVSAHQQPGTPVLALKPRPPLRRQEQA